MSSFEYFKNNDGTFHIECLFVVYRELFGHHPDFLPQDEERGKREGFSTKFWYLVEDDLTKEEARLHLKDYRKKYDRLITAIEHDDKRWNEFPFKDKDVVYSK